MGRLVASLFAMTLVLAGCEPAPVVGASCMYPSDCRRPLTCRFDRCRNECTLNRDCPTGATCLVDSRGQGVCGVNQDVGCEDGVRCDDALVCVLDRCVARCSDATDCPDDGVCAAVAGTSVRVCFDEREEIPDAEIPDGGTSDVGALDAGVDAAQGDSGAPVTTVEMCIGPNGMCALTSEGYVFCWGLGNNGRIGHGDELDSTTPLPVLGRAGTPLVEIDHIACGSGFGCAHDGHTGIVLCWGDGSDHGGFGVDATTSLVADEVHDDVPRARIEVVGGRMSAAGYHICVLDTNTETLTCWGDNSGLLDVSHPFLGVGAEPLPPGPPLGIGGVTDVAEIGVAAGGACVIHDTDRSVSCWGENSHGEASASPFTPPSDLVGLTPVALSGAERAYILTVGWNHRALRLDGSGDLVSWGSNATGQLADSTAVDTATPVPPAIGTPAFIRIASDGFSNTTCGVISGEASAIPRRVRCWGDNNLGQAGLGTRSAYVEPEDDVLVESTGLPLEGVERVFIGPRNGCAATATGELWCWGENDLGQLGPPSDASVHRARLVVIPAP